MADLKSDSQGFLVGKGGKDALELILDNTEQTLKEVKKDVRAAKRAATVKHSLTVKQTPVKTVKPINAAKTEKLNLDRANLRDAQGRFIKQQALETSNFRQAKAKATMIHQGQMKELIEAVSKGNKGSSSGIMSKLGALGLGLKALSSGRALGTLAKGAGGLLAGGGLKKAGNLSKILKIGGIGAALSALGMLSGISSVENSNMSRGMKNYTHFKNGAGGLGGLGGMLGGAAIGQALIPIPVIGALIGGLAGGMLGTKASEAAIDAIDRRFPSNTAERMFSSWKGFTDVATAGVSTFWKENAPTSWQGFVTSATGFASSAFTNISKSFEGVVSNIGKIFTDIGTSLKNAWNNSSVGQTVNKAVKPAVEWIGDKYEAGKAYVQDKVRTLNNEHATYTQGTLKDDAATRKRLHEEALKKKRFKHAAAYDRGHATAGTYLALEEAVSAMGSDFHWSASMKDSFHEKRNANSSHNKGLAFDVSTRQRTKQSGAVNSKRIYDQLSRKGLKGVRGVLVKGKNGKLRFKALEGNGTDFKIIDEYHHLSGHGSGGHIHVQLSENGNNAMLAASSGGKITGSTSRSSQAVSALKSGAQTVGNVVGGVAKSTIDFFKNAGGAKGKLANAIRGHGAEKAAAWADNFKGGAINGLSLDDTKKFASLVAATESGYNHTIGNDHGYSGSYQMGVDALEDIGLVKKGSLAAGIKKHGRKNASRILSDSSIWNNGLNLNKFLGDKALQDQSFSNYANVLLKQLKAKGVDVSKYSSSELMAVIKSAWLKGAGSYSKYLKTGKDVRDGNGTSMLLYGNEAAAFHKANNFQVPKVNTPAIPASEVAQHMPKTAAINSLANNSQYSLADNVARKPTQHVSQPAIGHIASGGTTGFRNH